MHTLMITADEYEMLQQVFARHFHQQEAYMERLIDAMLVHSSAVAAIAPDDRRRYVRETAPEYLFQKRGLAADREWLSEIRRSLSNQRTMALTGRDFHHIAALVVSTLAALLPDIAPLYAKIQELVDLPVANHETVVLVLRVDFDEWM